MNKSLKESLHIELLLLAVFSLLAIGIKSFFFYQYNFITKDDFSSYIPMAENLISHQFISVDGRSAHTLFPPGFPIMLAVIKFLTGSYEFAFYINYVLVTTLTSLIAYFLFRDFLSSNSSIATIPLLFLYPLFFTSNKILGTSSEYFFNLFIWTGFYFLFRYILRTKNFVNLILCNSAFSIAYLIRPEGLLFFSSIVIALALFQFRQFKSLKTWIAFLIPMVIFVLPYIYFLYYHLHQWTLSGKVVWNQQLSLQRFGKPYQLWLSNAIAVFKFIFALEFFNPLIIIGTLVFVYFLMRKEIEKLAGKFILIMMLPACLILIPLVLYFPWSRGLYPFIPVMIFCTVIGFNVLFQKFKLTQVFQVIIYTIIISASLLISMQRKSFSEDVFIFKQSARYLNEHEQERVLTVCSRQPMMSYYLNKNFNHQSVENIISAPDIFILANFNHYTIHPVTEFEKLRADSSRFNFSNTEYVLQHQINSGSFVLKIFTRH